MMSRPEPEARASSDSRVGVGGRVRGLVVRQVGRAHEISRSSGPESGSKSSGERFDGVDRINLGD